MAVVYNNKQENTKKPPATDDRDVIEIVRYMHMYNICTLRPIAVN